MFKPTQQGNDRCNIKQLLIQKQITAIPDYVGQNDPLKYAQVLISGPCEYVV